MTVIQESLNPFLTFTKKHSYETIYYRVLVFFVIDLRVILLSTDQFFGSAGNRVNLQRLINLLVPVEN